MILIYQAFTETKNMQKQKGLDTKFCLPFAYIDEDFYKPWNFHQVEGVLEEYDTREGLDQSEIDYFSVVLCIIG